MKMLQMILLYTDVFVEWFRVTTTMLFLNVRNTEEAGLRPIDPLTPLGCFDPDSGRLENRFWGFFAPRTEPEPGFRPEPGLVRDSLTPDALIGAINEGRFTMALHIALIGLARLRGLI